MRNTFANRRACFSLLAMAWWALHGMGFSYGQPPTEKGNIYWTEWEAGIHRFSLDSQMVERLIKPDLRRPGKIALDLHGEMIYWMDSHTIRRSDLDGENLDEIVMFSDSLNYDLFVLISDSLNYDGWEVEILRGKTAGIVQDMALDLAGEKIYWTTLFDHGDYFLSAVMRSTLEGTNVEIISETDRFRSGGIALDFGAGKVYWVDSQNLSISRADLDGAAAEVVITGLADYPEDIALDLVRGKLYWTNPYQFSIRRVDLDGANAEDILTGLSARPREIALDVVEGKLYWTGWSNLGTGSIHRADLDGANPEHLLDLGWGKPIGMALDLDRGKIFWTDVQGTIQRADLDGSGSEALFSPMVRSTTGIVLDDDKGKMYWADITKGAIQRSDLDGSNIEDIVTGLNHPKGIAMFSGEKIYWMDSGDQGTSGKIQGANIDGTEIEEIVHGLSYPIDMALDPVRGKIYWRDEGGRAIHRADLDGSNIEDLLDGLYGSGGLALDNFRNKIFWVGVDEVRCSNLDGSQIEIVLTDSDIGRVAASWSNGYGDLALDLVRDKIYWVSERREAGVSFWDNPLSWGEIYRSDLDGSNIEYVGGGGRNGIALDISRQTSVLTPDSLPERPAASGLLFNYPNPFNTQTAIEFHIPPTISGDVSIDIFNLGGQKVRSVAVPGGSTRITWDGTSREGLPVASGVYFYRLRIDDRSWAVRRMVLVR